VRIILERSEFRICILTDEHVWCSIHGISLFNYSCDTEVVTGRCYIIDIMTLRKELHGQCGFNITKFISMLISPIADMGRFMLVIHIVKTEL
jgi:hypothetical protein